MKITHILAHMRAARAYAQASHAVRRKVGAVLVKHNSPIASGWNGTPAGHHNCCESECGTKTLDTVIHAEVNTYRKLLKLYETSHDTQLFVTCLPCKNCAEYIANQTDTREIYFAEVYRSMDGAKVLLDAGCKLFYVEESSGKVYSTKFLGAMGELVCHNLQDDGERITLRVDQPEVETPFLFEIYPLIQTNCFDGNGMDWKFGPWAFHIPKGMGLNAIIKGFGISVMDVFKILDSSLTEEFPHVEFEYKSQKFIYCGGGITFFIPKGGQLSKTGPYQIQPILIDTFERNSVVAANEFYHIHQMIKDPDFVFSLS